MKQKLLSLIIFLTFIGIGSAFEISKIKFVDQNGNDIPYDMFITRIKIKPGMQFSPKLLSDAIKSIYETKKIKDVAGDVVVVAGEYQLVFKMVLNVIVSEIAYEGNTELDEDHFAEEVQHLEGIPLDMEQLAKDKGKIFELYSKEGHFNTEIDIKTVTDMRFFQFFCGILMIFDTLTQKIWQKMVFTPKTPLFCEFLAPN